MKIKILSVVLIVGIFLASNKNVHIIPCYSSTAIFEKDGCITTCIYNEKGRLIATITKYSDTWIEKIWNAAKKMVWLETNNEILNTTYTYDAMGNLIKQSKK
jgi:hypothetical protein